MMLNRILSRLERDLGAGVPVAGIIIHDRLNAFEDLMEDLHTFQNNQLGLPQHLKPLKLLKETICLKHVKAMGEYFTKN